MFVLQKPGNTKERHNSSAENHSKIAAFLPARQLWAWSGKGVKRPGAKGRGKKQFFKTIQRGKETITVRFTIYCGDDEFLEINITLFLGW